MDRDDFYRQMQTSGWPVSEWANGPHYRYRPHSHPYRKFLYCLEGSIVFHTEEGDLPLLAGQQMTLDAGIEHGATVGPAGVRCAEAHAG